MFSRSPKKKKKNQVPRVNVETLRKCKSKKYDYSVTSKYNGTIIPITSDTEELSLPYTNE